MLAPLARLDVSAVEPRTLYVQDGGLLIALLGWRTLLLVVVASGASAPAAAQRLPLIAECKIQRIVDGDTVECARGRTRIMVRLLGIDAPERNQGPYGKQATQFLETTIPPGSMVLLDRDVRERDRYGRLLAYLWTDSATMVNEDMLRAGLAVVDIQPPNVKYADELRAAARAAREAQVGLWATPAFTCLPVDFRRKKCR